MDGLCRSSLRHAITSKLYFSDPYTCIRYDIANRKMARLFHLVEQCFMGNVTSNDVLAMI